MRADDVLQYSYNKVFNGFAASLSEEEARELASKSPWKRVFLFTFFLFFHMNYFDLLSLISHPLCLEYSYRASRCRISVQKPVQRASYDEIMGISWATAKWNSSRQFCLEESSVW